MKIHGLVFTILFFPQVVFCQSQQPMRMFFGVNAAVAQDFDNPEDVQPLVGWIRDYSKWHLFEPENNKYHFTDVRDSIDHDSIYRHIRKLGIKTLMCIQKAPQWISSAPEKENFGDFAPSGQESGLKPEHYKEAAEFYFQLAARYGSKEVAAENLKTEDKKSGMDIVNAIEVLNEADGAFEWGNRIKWKQYAALLNAVYDGNKGALGQGYGIKNADPDLPVSVTGLGFNLPSLKSLKTNAGRIPYDIINIHFYAFRYARKYHRVAVAPEWSSLESDMQEIVNWRDENAPGRPVWLTEIGWDTGPYSTEEVSEQEAANYLIRSYLLAKGAGVDKAFWFYFRDLDDFERKGVFSTSGLFENQTVPYAGKTDLKPKLTYWYFGTMTHMLGDLYYVKNLSDSNVYHYRFASQNDDKRVDVLWYYPQYYYAWRQLVKYPEHIKTGLTLPDHAVNIRIIKPAAGSFKGIEHPVMKNENGISLKLNGRPVFVEYNLSP